MLRIAFTAIMLAAACMPAWAAQVGSYQFGNWLVGVHTDDTTGRFSSCVASAHYKSGITLYVAVSPDFQWDLGFSAEHWQLIPGQRISLRYRFDRSAWTQTTADVVTEKVVQMPMPTNGPVAQLFRRGRTMEVHDGRQSYFFHLDGTSRLLVDLVQCADVSARNAQVAAPNSSTEQVASPRPDAPAALPAADVAALKLEGTRVLSNFLLAADFNGAEILGEEDFPKELSFAHAVAVAGESVGFSMVVPGADMTPDALSAQIAATLSESCDGKFGTGATKDEMDNIKLINGFTACDKQGMKSLLQYVVISRKQGGQYVIGVVSVSPEASKGAPSTSGSPMVNSERLMNAAFKVTQ